MNPTSAIQGLLAALLLASAAEGAFAPLPPFIVYGKVRDWNGRILMTSDDAFVIAKNSNGLELARGPIVSGVYPDLTYRVSIPMANTNVAGRGQTGERLTFAVYYSDWTNSASTMANAVIGNPASSLECPLSLGTFSYGDELPDQYREILWSYYQLEGRTNSIYDLGKDDFDGDGFSNYQEYLAGTDPVLNEDYLRILNYFPQNNQFMALQFLSAPGRTYSISKSSQLGFTSAEQTGFSMSTNDLPAQTFYTSEQDAQTTLYLEPTNTAAFHGLDVK